MKKYCKDFKSFDVGLIVSPALPYLGATPDGKIYDPNDADQFGLLEIKCPYSWRNATMEEACQDPKFFCEQVGEDFKLKISKKEDYYAQVQGQMAISGLKWCDFVIFLSETRCLNVERIYFDEEYWSAVSLKLKDFYFAHCLPYFLNNS